MLSHMIQSTRRSISMDDQTAKTLQSVGRIFQKSLSPNQDYLERNQHLTELIADHKAVSSRVLSNLMAIV